MTELAKTSANLVLVMPTFLDDLGQENLGLIVGECIAGGLAQHEQFFGEIKTLDHALKFFVIDANYHPPA